VAARAVTPEAIDVAAQALRENQHRDASAIGVDIGPMAAWEELDESWRDTWRDKAQIALTAAAPLMVASVIQGMLEGAPLEISGHLKRELARMVDHVRS